MTLGIISDTHDDLPQGVVRVFSGVHQIVHAGDVCVPELIVELSAIAPVTVVAGNNDSHPAWRDTEILELGGHRLLIEHIVNPHQPRPGFRERLARVQPGIVIFGHSHRPFSRRIDGVLYLNPGAAGAPRFGLPRSVCLLHLDKPEPGLEFIPLDSSLIPPVPGLPNLKSQI